MRCAFPSQHGSVASTKSSQHWLLIFCGTSTEPKPFLRLHILANYRSQRHRSKLINSHAAATPHTTSKQQQQVHFSLYKEDQETQSQIQKATMRTKTDANNDETLREPLLEVQPGTQNNLVPLPFFLDPWSSYSGVCGKN